MQTPIRALILIRILSYIYLFEILPQSIWEGLPLINREKLKKDSRKGAKDKKYV
jgi:hypothetical protein